MQEQRRTVMLGKHLAEAPSLRQAYGADDELAGLADVCIGALIQRGVARQSAATVRHEFYGAAVGYGGVSAQTGLHGPIPEHHAHVVIGGCYYLS